MSYSRRLGVCESFRFVVVNGVVRLEIKAGHRLQHFALAEAGTPPADIAMALETDRAAAIKSDDE